MVSVYNLLQRISAAGLTSPAEVASCLAGVRPSDPGRRLAGRLVRRGLLTAYQAEALLGEPPGPVTLGGYVLLSRLGRGGMGVVFKARHRRTGRAVALKILPAAAAAKADRLRRFGREVEAAFRVRNPNAVLAFDAGEADGLRFLATEYVDGTDLGRLVAAGGPLPVTPAVDYVVQAARGLGHAHDLGIVHRDVKPSNLLLETAPGGGDASGTVKVTDFGLASVARLDPDAADSDTLVPGTAMGTADYIPPEQSFDANAADRRSDVYGLGGTLFFLLTGRPMFPGRTPLEVLLAHRDRTAPSLRAFRGDVPEALDLVYRQAVAKRPEDRPPTAAELIALLEGAVAVRTADVGGAPPRTRISLRPGGLSAATNFRLRGLDEPVASGGTDILPAIAAADAPPAGMPSSGSVPRRRLGVAAVAVTLAASAWLAWGGSHVDRAAVWGVAPASDEETDGDRDRKARHGRPDAGGSASRLLRHARTVRPTADDRTAPPGQS